jgi:hypothetical protein
MGAKGQRQGWQRHSVDEYKEYIGADDRHTITAEPDPELMYPDEPDGKYVDTDEYFRNWEHYNQTCETCAHGCEGVCYVCAGDNLGYGTEISNKGTCSNWETI